MTPEEIKQVDACADAIAKSQASTTVDERSFIYFLQARDDAELTDNGRMRLNQISAKLGI